ncbi:MAG: hypothetical protein NC910_02725 [Candidatus Omnitrophica bacterium]|nr:hypothetical protein [Candidatus Omnitrophota bacterium]
MFRRWYLYWRWLRIKRVKVGRAIEVELPRFSRMSEYAAGDNFPVLSRTLVRAE